MKRRLSTKESVAEPSECEVFEFCGPHLLTCVDWSRLEQRKSVAASLVKGVYVLERDHQQYRPKHKQLAPMWWEFFHFKCIQTLEDEYDKSIFGAIFEYTRKTSNQIDSLAPPKYVIAFRGTLIKPRTIVRDCYMDVKIFFNFNGTSRSKSASVAVKGILEKADPRDVWLAGHSLGASLALQTGRNMVMAKQGCNIETYLFNPPYASAPIEFLGYNGHVKNGTRMAKSIVTAGLSLALKPRKNTKTHAKDDTFTALRSWIPYMFVNPGDPICSEYIGYFEHREKMERWGAGRIERIATTNSIVNLLTTALRKDGEALHLIPSAHVIKNVEKMEDGLLEAHSLCQWWKEHSCRDSYIYQQVYCRMNTFIYTSEEERR